MSCEYLREFSKKFETALMVYSGARGKLILKKPEVKNLVALSLGRTKQRLAIKKDSQITNILLCGCTAAGGGDIGVVYSVYNVHRQPFQCFSSTYFDVLYCTCSADLKSPLCFLSFMKFYFSYKKKIAPSAGEARREEYNFLVY